MNNDNSAPAGPRVFTLHYPQGESRLDDSSEPKDNGEIANAVINSVAKAVNSGKSIGIALPLALGTWKDTPVAQWELREVQRVDEEKYGKLLQVARAAVNLVALVRIAGVQILDSEESRKFPRLA